MKYLLFIVCAISFCNAVELNHSKNAENRQRTQSTRCRKLSYHYLSENGVKSALRYNLSVNSHSAGLLALNTDTSGEMQDENLFRDTRSSDSHDTRSANQESGNKELHTFTQYEKERKKQRKKEFYLDEIHRRRTQTIGGSVVFFGALGMKYFIYPAIVNANVDPNDTSAIINASIFAMPIRLADIIGATVSCVGASRLYVAYIKGFNPNASDVNFWKPYAIGWICGVIGTATSLFSGLAEVPEMVYIATAFDLGRDIAWTVSTVWALVYSGKTTRDARERAALSFYKTPEGAPGIAISLQF
jgi:hypothetical protein